MHRAHDITIREIISHRWDAVIVGTGMGGATLGYALARAGWRVLFCEKGKSSLPGCEALRGDYAEMFFPRPETPQPKHQRILSQAGRQVDEIYDLSLAKSRRFIPFIGSGTGGSTALYGMALERLFPGDFTPRKHYPRASDSTIPDNWPISYADLAPYYATAERLYGVHASADHFKRQNGATYAEAPPPFSPAAQELADFFRQQGLHPYHLPLACKDVSRCRCCQGYLCDKNCKNDSGRICLLPALSEYGAVLLDECEVLRLEAEHDAISAVVCRYNGREVHLKGAVVVLAAGALATPRLLLQSASTDWPNGLANQSGLVGKNLMRHYVDLYAVFPKTRRVDVTQKKELGCNDFYLRDGEKYGSIQSFGAMPPAAIVVESLHQEVRDKLGRRAATALGPTKSCLKSLLIQLFSRTLVFATIMEDLPYVDNQVMLSGNRGTREGIAIRYRIREHDAKRIEEFRRRMRGIFKPYRFMLFKQAHNNQRLAHVCGTCRFGSDPRESVLDSCNRAHGLSNLYVVDASFFPSSGGTNPALTIAANALRVAAILHESFSKY